MDRREKRTIGLSDLEGFPYIDNSFRMDVEEFG